MQFVDRRTDYFWKAFDKKGKKVGATAEHHIIPVKMIVSTKNRGQLPINRREPA
jgi:hypothetical protein